MPTGGCLARVSHHVWQRVPRRSQNTTARAGAGQGYERLVCTLANGISQDCFLDCLATMFLFNIGRLYADIIVSIPLTR